MMRTAGISILIAAALLSLAASAAQSDPAGPQAEAAAVQLPGSAVSADGSHLDISLYLDVPELFRVLARVGAIPPSVVQQALAASKAEAARPGASTSYVKVEAHVRLAEIAPLLAAMAQHPRPAPPRPPAAMPAPSGGPPPQ